jgi:hypothetical protein
MRDVRQEKRTRVVKKRNHKRVKKAKTIPREKEISEPRKREKKGPHPSSRVEQKNFARVIASFVQLAATCSHTIMTNASKPTKQPGL